MNAPQKTDFEQANAYREYERRKQEWIDTHPGSTSFNYEVAVKQIARDCGV